MELCWNLKKKKNHSHDTALQQEFLPLETTRDCLHIISSWVLHTKVPGSSPYLEKCLSKKLHLSLHEVGTE